MTGRTKKQAEPDEARGAPEWMVTFSDCVTLLLTFFVLLLSFSSFDDKVFRRLRVIFTEALPSTGACVKDKDRDAFLPATRVQHSIVELEKGSEKPTLASGREDSLKEETGEVDFHRRKVFLIPSKKIFWGKGTAISSGGRGIMTAMASFLREVAGRVVISEGGPGDNKPVEELGLPRAWVVVEYLTAKRGLDKNRFSISAASTLTEESFRDNGPEGTGAGGAAESERVLEIVLLERSIYN